HWKFPGKSGSPRKTGGLRQAKICLPFSAILCQSGAWFRLFRCPPSPKSLLDIYRGRSLLVRVLFCGHRSLPFSYVDGASRFANTLGIRICRQSFTRVPLCRSRLPGSCQFPFQRVIGLEITVTVATEDLPVDNLDVLVW